MKKCCDETLEQAANTLKEMELEIESLKKKLEDKDLARKSWHNAYCEESKRVDEIQKVTATMMESFAKGFASGKRDY